MSLSHKSITPERFEAVLFDLDGVLTSTAEIHSRCWKTMFDGFLRHRAAERKEPFRPFEIPTDYKRYVDGKLRDEGVRSFLASRRVRSRMEPQWRRGCGLAAGANRAPFPFKNATNCE
jgi:beta-phosphoglucomutase-like phosphatase (HAD superfamily)